MRLAAVWDDPRRALGLLVLGGYVGFSFAVGNAYPFSVFDMYARPRTTASRIVARDAGGALTEVERWDAWMCPGPVDTSAEACREQGPYFAVGYIDASRAAWVTGHSAGPAEGAGEAREPVEVVRRIWWLEGEGAPRSSDCVLARCSAVRR